MANNKKTLYVGGLSEDVDINMIRSAFLPFGDIADVNLPMDYSTHKHKGFAFIEFHLAEDAADAIDNMDNSEILGRTIRVNIARPNKFKDSNNRPIWADDEYLRKLENNETEAETADVSMDDGDGNNAEQDSEQT